MENITRVCTIFTMLLKFGFSPINYEIVAIRILLSISQNVIYANFGRTAAIWNNFNRHQLFFGSVV